MGNRYRLDPDGAGVTDTVREMPDRGDHEAAARAAGSRPRRSYSAIIPVDADDCDTVFEVRFRYLHDPRAVASIYLPTLPKTRSAAFLRGLRNMGRP